MKAFLRTVAFVYGKLNIVKTSNVFGISYFPARPYTEADRAVSKTTHQKV